MGHVWNSFFLPRDYVAIKPEIILTIFGMAVLLVDPLLFRDKRDKVWNAVFAILGLSFTFLQLALFVAQGFPGGLPDAAFDGRFTLDTFAVFLKLIIVFATILVVLISGQYLEIEEAHFGEYYALLLFSVVGMMFMVSATDLIVLFLGLEVMALCEYVLVGFLRGDRRSNEGAMKFFLLGAFSSGLLLYGMSLLYGISGSTKLSEISQSLAARHVSDPIAWVAMITLLAGLFFKIAAVPFHQWTPDAYEGAPTSITAFISVAPKVASFAILLRLLFTGMGPLHLQWQALMIGVAIATMTLGNLAAVTSTNIKRFFGYSTIAHVGYLLLGVIAAAEGNFRLGLIAGAEGNRTGLAAVVIYLVVYTFMNLGAFSVIILMRRKEIVGDQIDDFAGLMARAPGMAILMLIFLLSLAGIPPTAGFIGKYYIFLSLVQTGHLYLAVLGVAYAVVALYYYFRIVAVMFMQKAPDSVPLATSPGLAVALGVAISFTLAIGIYPEPLIVAARNAILPFFS